MDTSAIVLEMAAQPYVAEVGTSRKQSPSGMQGGQNQTSGQGNAQSQTGGQGTNSAARQTVNLKGKLVCETEDAYAAWAENDLVTTFAPLGGIASVARLDISRPEANASSRMGGGSGDTSITYQNTGNDATGDADIDAVTVICPGDYADCKPSN